MTKSADHHKPRRAVALLHRVGAGFENRCPTRGPTKGSKSLKLRSLRILESPRLHLLRLVCVRHRRAVMERELAADA